MSSANVVLPIEGTRREDDEIGFLESRKKGVEVGESGRDAAEGVIALVELIDTLKTRVRGWVVWGRSLA
jgi:molybdopterin biosynthesis enzyme